MDNIQVVRGARHLRRLEMLIDVVFALLIWDIVSTLPLPEGSDLSFAGLGEFLGGNLDLGIVLIGMVIVLNYWAQNNSHSGELAATNSTHALLSILQLFFLLFILMPPPWVCSLRGMSWLWHCKALPCCLPVFWVSLHGHTPSGMVVCSLIMQRKMRSLPCWCDHLLNL
jgi:hypothetical protein